MQNNSELIGFDLPIKKVDVDEARKALEREIILQETERELTEAGRRKQILLTVKQQLSRGERVEITPEMEMLGIDSNVRALAFEADHFWRINRYLVDADDLDDDY